MLPFLIMVDVFVSYANMDRERAKLVVDALRFQGWSVWWDRQILPGESFAHAIDTAIHDCRCVVVLWSMASVESQWVRSEADEGRRRGILVPVRLDEVRPPRPFDTIHTADLVYFPSSVSDYIAEYRPWCI
jgi:adenylate cyclase